MDGRHGRMVGEPRRVEVMVGALRHIWPRWQARHLKGCTSSPKTSAPKGTVHTRVNSQPTCSSLVVAGAIVGWRAQARFGDTDDKVKAKVQALVDEGLQAVFCCGEPLKNAKRDGKRTWCMPN